MCIFRVQVVACQMSKKLSQTLSKIHIAYTYTQVSMARSRSNSLLHTICTTYLDFLIQERASSSKSLEPSVLHINISMRDPWEKFKSWFSSCGLPVNPSVASLKKDHPCLSKLFIDHHGRLLIVNHFLLSWTLDVPQPHQISRPAIDQKWNLVSSATLTVLDGRIEVCSMW